MSIDVLAGHAHAPPPGAASPGIVSADQLAVSAADLAHVPVLDSGAGPKAGGAASPGLVPCAITGRISDAGPGPGQISDVWARGFSGPERVLAAAETFGRPTLAGNAAVSSFAIVIAPGVLRMAGSNDMQHPYWANPWAFELTRGHGDRERKVRGEVMSWTRKSRAKMACTLAALDWSYLQDVVGLPAMVTLTYPADWLTVAPSGKAVKEHLKVLRKRWERAWGEPPKCAWKLEFQRRGAPHIHMGPVAVPLGRAGAVRHVQQEAARVAGARVRCRPAAGDGLPFNRWLSVTWADIVNHPDPAERELHERAGTNVDYKQGMRCADPKRLAVYFSKHGQWATKEYQNSVPDEWQAEGKGPGRFWGYWGLEPCRVMVELDRQEHLLASRTLRRMSERSHVWSPDRFARVVPAVREVTVYRRRVNPLTGEVVVRRRKVRRPVRRLKSHRGFVCVNDAPKLAAELARLVNLTEVK